MIFKVQEWASNGYFAICCTKPECNTFFIWKDGSVHHNDTGWDGAGRDFDTSPGFWSTRREAEIFLTGWLSLQQKEVEKPYQFKAGDVVKFYEDKRIIVQIDGQLCAIDINGVKHCNFGTVQSCSYEKIGKLSDYIK